MSAAAWAVDALIASALLMLAVLLARGPVRRAFGPRVAYALWALPALRLLLPPLPAGWWRAEAATPIRQAGETITVLVIDPALPASGPSLGFVLALVWAAGVVAFLLWHLVGHARFRARVLRGAEAIEMRDDIRIVASEAAPGPLAFGLWRRYVAFPRDFAARYDADEQALALAHELGHHARRDLHANWAALVVLALHWFNPLAWHAFRAFRADQELANDARVLAACPVQARHAYGRAIVKTASPHALGGPLSAACHLHAITDLKGRLKMLTISGASRRRLATGSAAVALLVAGGLGLTASSSAAERVAERLAAPVPPTAPAMPAPVAQAAPTAPVASPPVPPKRTKRVVVVKDGKATIYEGEAADKYIAENKLPIPPVPPAPPSASAPGEARIFVRRMVAKRDQDGKLLAWGPMEGFPQISSMRCPGDAKQPVVETSTKNGKRVMVICNNRIAAMTQDAERLAMNGELFARQSMFSARSSLRMARNAIEADRDLSDDRRRQALAGIDQAEAELREDARD